MAAQLGLRPGDVVVGMNGERLVTLAEFEERASSGERPVVLDVVRGNRSRRLVLR